MNKHIWKITVNFIPLPESEKEARYKLWADSFKHVKKIKPKGKTVSQKIRSP